MSVAGEPNGHIEIESIDLVDSGTNIPIDPAHFRDVLGHFSTGVVVITADNDGVHVGMTCQSVVSLSIEPPLVLFTPAKSSTTWPKIREAGHFCVNILAEDQEHLSLTFAKSGGEKFVDVAFRKGKSGAPILENTLAQIECTIESIYEGGDHDIVVGRVIDLGIHRSSTPLIFFRGAFLHP